MLLQPKLNVGDYMVPAGNQLPLWHDCCDGVQHTCFTIGYHTTVFPSWCAIRDLPEENLVYRLKFSLMKHEGSRHDSTVIENGAGGDEE